MRKTNTTMTYWKNRYMSCTRIGKNGLTEIREKGEAVVTNLSQEESKSHVSSLRSGRQCTGIAR